MDHFEYRDGELHAEEVRLAALAERVGTPAYVYSAATFDGHLDRLRGAFAPLDPLVCFAVKSCANVHVLRRLGARGAGMDVVSGGELYRARAAGVPGDRTVFAGVGKTEDEIRAALALDGSGGDAGPIALFNVESEPEYEAIATIARGAGARARAALRINPDVDPGSHEYTATGKRDSKFGVSPEHGALLLRRFGRERHLRLSGVHLHIGSPVQSTAPYVEAITRACALMDGAARDGVATDVLDIGGGFGADYETGGALPASAYAEAIVPLLEPRVRDGLRVVLEPGRSIAANAGVLLTRVLYVKLSGTRKFVVCDAGMHTLLRPALYHAFHFIWPVSVSPAHTPVRREERPDLPGLETADVVGPVCESGDFLARDRALPPVAPGDLLAVFAAGAYGMTMASRYNSHPLPPEVLVEGARARVIRRRESLEDLVAHERVPEDLAL